MIGVLCFLQIFGPVQSIMRFESMDELERRANKTIYGLAASVMSRDIERALGLAHIIRAGTIWSAPLILKLKHSAAR